MSEEREDATTEEPRAAELEHQQVEDLEVLESESQSVTGGANNTPPSGRR
jgi:hypothetical protein